MNNIKWFKIFIVCLVVITLGFLSWQLIAQIETGTSVQKFLAGSPSCPNFAVADKNDLTMKDSCTGLVWMSRPLPNDRSSASAENGVPPGYTWALAKSQCEAIKLSTGANLFRLPTVEELLSLVKLQCPSNNSNSSNCKILSDYFPGDIDKNFANGYFWASNDFNEAPSWKTDNAGRDYKRSVNLLTGQVDSPVFGKDVLLNAWCVVDRQPEIIERKFASVTNQIIDNGSQATGGSLLTVFNRKCSAETAETACDDLSGSGCDTNLKYCTKIEDLSLAAQQTAVAKCVSNYHVEGLTCVVNTAEQNCGNSRIDTTPILESCDDGSYNGTPGYCIDCTGCGAGYTIDSVNHKCVPICGDGSVNAPEVCDKGTAGQADKCNSTCTSCLTGFYLDTVSHQCIYNCGNNKIDSLPDGTAEACDNGTANGQTDKCNTACTGCGAGYSVNTSTHQCVINCGNGTIDTPEVCDKGASGQSDKCNSTCSACLTGYHLNGSVCVANTTPGTVVACTDNSVCSLGESCQAGTCKACAGFNAAAKKFTVTNSSSTDLTDYQVKFGYDAPRQTVDLEPGFNEVLNITDAHCIYIPYYTEIIDEETCPTDNATCAANVWVKVPRIPANGTADIYVSSTEVATTWVPDAPYTFELYEDFSDDTELLTNWTIMGAGTGINDWPVTQFNGSYDNNNCNAFVGNALSGFASEGMVQGSTFTDGVCGTGGSPVVTVNKKFTYLGFTSKQQFKNNFRVLSKFFIPGNSSTDNLNSFKVIFGLNSGVLSLKSNTIDLDFYTHFAYWDNTARVWKDIVTPPLTNPLTAPTFPQNFFVTKQRQIEEIYSDGKLKLNMDGTSYVNVSISGDYGDGSTTNPLNFAYAPDQDGVDLFRAGFSDIMVTKYRLKDDKTAEAVSISPLSY